MAKRLGTSFNVTDNELRLLAIEQELKNKAASNGATVQTVTKENPISTSQVTGLRVDRNIVGGISVSWNAVRDKGLSRYEVYISEDSFFPSDNTTVFNITGGGTSFLYQNGNPTKTYFFKVRAVSEKGVGLFSSTLNTKTGQAATDNLQTGAATGIVKGTQLFSGGSGLIHANNSLEFGAISTVTTGGPVLVFATIQMTVVLQAAGTSLTLQIFEDDIEIESFTYSITGVSSNVTVVGGFPGLAIPSTPNAGQHVYKFKITNDVVSGDVTLTKLRRSLIELRAA